MNYECNEELEQALVLVKVAKTRLEAIWTDPMGHAELRDRQWLLGRLQDEIQDMREIAAKLKDKADG